ncbi:MAG: hypothetical protein Q7S33_01480 [Nanoarchaeota archaeon]|nr:hypothetical protein [Nanoarchaeota archaeon]
MENMKKSDKIEPTNQELYSAIIGNRAAMIFGKDFSVLNYGENYGNILNGGKRLIRISGSKKSFEFSADEKEIPNNLYFNTKPPYLKLSEASHVNNLQSFYTSFSLDQLVEILQKKGIKFEE